MTDVGLKYIAGLSNITSLNLHQCDSILYEGFRRISHLTKMTDLNLSSNKELVDESLALFSNFTNLKKLNREKRFKDRIIEKYSLRKRI